MVLILWILFFIIFFVYAILTCLFIAVLSSPPGEGLTSLLSCFFCHFPIWCPGSGIVIDCIDF